MHIFPVYTRAFFKDFSVEGPTTKRDFREKRKSEEIFPFGGSGVQHDFSLIFRQKGTLLGGRPEPFSGGGGGRAT